MWPCIRKELKWNAAVGNQITSSTAPLLINPIIRSAFPLGISHLIQMHRNYRYHLYILQSISTVIIIKIIIIVIQSHNNHNYFLYLSCLTYNGSLISSFALHPAALPPTFSPIYSLYSPFFGFLFYPLSYAPFSYPTLFP